MVYVVSRLASNLVRQWTGKAHPFLSIPLRGSSLGTVSPTSAPFAQFHSSSASTSTSCTGASPRMEGASQLRASPGSEEEHIRLLESLRAAVKATCWQLLGTESELTASKCTKFYSKQSGQDDMALFYHDGKFYSMDATCPHEGGPLELGDIEDFNGESCVMCPWHEFDFSLATGRSSMGLQQDTYEVVVVDSEVYVKSDTPYAREKPSARTADSRGPSSSAAEATASVDTTPSADTNTLSHRAVQVLNTVDLAEKVRLSRSLYSDWQSGGVTQVGRCQPPDQPPRRDDIVVLPSSKLRYKKSKSKQGVINLLHALCNIELWAVDLSWDIVARFSDFTVGDDKTPLPTEFFAEWAKVADDESKHFDLLNSRLVALGSHFGANPVHNGLWDHAHDTAEDLLGRLAVVHMVHEGRGLDVQPVTRDWLAEMDPDSLPMMVTIIEEEITHVGAGIKWFRWICEHSTPPLDGVSTFQALVRKYFFPGYLKPPFNKEARELAGFTEEWYLPLVKPKAIKK
ncbi:uncharacterized protein LOC135822561 [Sycon ciliatum]|uniref:uncharacterized protein LOC135822561 n=1 Tax=Sycon ciliatum TaxID=27933 RepID=UPI0020ACF2B6|eukprot:scpid39568/ scgid31637/ Uncharacterized protein HI_0077